jgi:hypothetical protein
MTLRQRSPLSVLGSVVVAVLLVTTSVLVGGALAVGADTAQDSGGVAFESETYRVDPPETAAIGVEPAESGLFRVRIESPGDHFTVELVLGQSQRGPDGGTPTVFLDTGQVDADPSASLSAENATIHRITVHEHDVDGDLPGGQYDLRAIQDGERSSATLAVTPSVRFGFDSSVNRSALERQPVQTLSGETDLPPGERVQILVTSTGSASFRLENGAVVDEDGRFETTIDFGPVPAGANFDVVARHDNVTRARRSIRLFSDLPEPVDGRQTSNSITFAYEGDQLTLTPGANQTISGETTLPAGSVLTVILRSPDSHLAVLTTDVGEFGAFAVTADLGHVGPRDDVVVSALGPSNASGAAPVEIVGPGDSGGAPSGAAVQLDRSGDSVRPAGDSNRASGVVAIAIGVGFSIAASTFLLGLHRRRAYWQ